MRHFMTATTLVLVPSGLVAQERAAFIVRIGSDTVAVEQFTRTRDRIEGRCVLRTPRTVDRAYTAAIGRGGAVTTFEMRTAGRPEVATLAFTGDQAGALPFVSNCWGVLELTTRRFSAAGVTAFQQPVLRPGASPDTIAVERRAPDSVTVTVIESVPYRVAVDRQGRIRGAAWAGDWSVERVRSLDVAGLAAEFTRRPLGTLSPADSVRAAVGGATIAVKYSRPAARGRVIFGNLVPWGEVWRTGANEATLFSTTADLEMGGVTIPAGRYTIWTVPGETGWKLIVNKNTGQWGTSYAEQYDLARLDMRVERLPAPVERFTIAVEPRGGDGVLRLEWETTRASIDFRPKPALKVALLTRLGADTLAVEEYTRTATELAGQQVVRTPRSVHRLFRATFGPDGSLRTFDLITHNITGEPGPAETRATLDFAGDTAVARFPRGDSTVTVRTPGAAGALPWGIHIYALVEEIARRARAQGGDSVGFTAINLAGGQPLAVSVKRAAGGAQGDSEGHQTARTVKVGQLGPWTVTLDEDGRLASVSGKGSTLQIEVERAEALEVGAMGPTFASRSLGILSGRDTARAALAGAEVLVDYGVPAKRGRAIFGDVVPWGQVWRTGANAATQLHTTADLVVGGARVPAGQYTLWTIPTPSGWTLVINKKTQDTRGAALWGTMYDATEDLVRVPLKVEALGAPVEQLAITLEPRGRGRGALLKMAWDETLASVELQTARRQDAKTP